MSQERWRKADPGPTPAKKSAAAKPSGGNAWRLRPEKKVATAKSTGIGKALAGVVGFVLILAAIFWVLTWLFPLPAPKVVILSAGYRNSSELPPNAFALRDAATLKAQQGVLETSTAVADPLTKETMPSVIDAIPAIPFPKRFWFYGRTTAIVYANCYGVALADPSGQPTAYLLPDDFPSYASKDVIRSAIPLRQVLEKLLRSAAEQKLLVLDCQRLDQVWPLGVLNNQFIAAVEKDLRALSDRLPEGIDAQRLSGLYVLCSCSPGEVTAVDNAQQQSVFGYNFSRGLAGQADQTTGDGNGRVSLDELFKFVHKEVTDWTSTYRANSQTPLLYVWNGNQWANSGASAGAAPGAIAANLPSLAGIELAVVKGKQFTALASPQDDRAVEDELRKAWQAHYELARVRPYRYAPQEWRNYEAMLLRADQFWRAGDRESVTRMIFEATDRWNEIKELANDRKKKGDAYSFALAPLLARESPFGKSESIVNQVVKREKSLGEAPDLLRADLRGRPWPIEAHFVLMLKEHLFGRSEAPGAADPVDAACRAVDLRQYAERVAGPSAATLDGSGARILPWVKGQIQAADHDRRLSEDLLFAGDSKLVPVGSDEPAKDPGRAAKLHESAKKSYDNAKTDSQKVATAIAAYERALAEVPYWVRLAAARGWEAVDTGLRPVVERVLPRLLEQTHILGKALYDELKDPGSIGDRIAKVVDSSKAVTEVLEQLRGEYAGRVAALSDQETAAATQVIWHEIDYLLAAPFAFQLDRPDESAARRIRLLNRASKLPGSADGSAQASIQRGKLAGGAAEPAALAELAYAFFRLGLDDAASRGDGNPVAQNWRKLYSTGTIEAADLNAKLARNKDLSKIEPSIRLLEGSKSPAGDKLIRKLQDLELADYLRWQAERMTKDFWGPIGESPPYFQTAAKNYLKLAAEIDPRPERKRIGDDLETKIDRLAAAPFEVQPNPPRIKLVTTESRRVGFTTVAPSDPLIQGLAAFRSSPEGKDLLSVVAEESKAADRFDYLVAKRQNAPAPQTDFTGSLYFRGRKSSRAVAIDLIEPERGPTIIYEGMKKPTADILVQLQQEKRLDLKILFLIDCSDSMGLGDQGISRMEVVKNVLTDFGRVVPAGSIDIGVRVFGMDVPFNFDYLQKNGILDANRKMVPQRRAEYDDLVEKAHGDTKTLLPLVPFDPREFQKAVDALRPTGATNLFTGVVRAKEDFFLQKDGAVVKDRNGNPQLIGGEKHIIVFSDGADSYETAAKLASGKVEENGEQALLDAYQGTEIKISVIGFQFEEKETNFRQLEKIAEKHGGTARAAENRDQLMSELGELVGLRKVAIYTQEPRKRLYETVLDPSSSSPYSVNPDRYDLRLANLGNRELQLLSLDASAGEKHEFKVVNDRLKYAFEDHGFEYSHNQNENPSGVVLRVKADPKDADLIVRFSLFKKDDFKWRPKRVSAAVTQDKTSFTFQNLLPNVPGFPVPVWQFTIKDWPAANQAQMEVRWSEANDPDEPLLHVTRMDSDGSRARELKHEFRLDSWTNNREKRTTRLVIAFPEKLRTDWSIRMPDRSLVENLRQIYNLEHHIFIGEYVWREGASIPDHFFIHDSPRENDEQKLVAPIKLERVFGRPR